IADAEVTAWLPGRTLGVDDLPLRHARTDPGGRFALVNLPLGRIKVNANHPDFLDCAKLETEVAESGAPPTLDLVLTAGRSITGRLELPSGAPATHVEVRASFDVTRISGPNIMDMTRGASSVAHTDDAGNFRLQGLGKGPFVVESLSERVLFEGGPVATWRARREGVFPGTENLALVLRSPLGVAGRVEDDEGAPLTRFSVTARRVTQGEFVTLSTAYRRGDFEAQDGTFFLQGLTEGQWEFEAQGVSAATGTGLLSPAPLTLELPRPVGVDPLVLRAVRSVTVSGRVLDFEGQALVGARVRLDTGGSGWQMEMNPFPDEPSARSGDAGKFLLTGLRPGAFALVATARDHAPSAPLALTLEPGQVVDDALLRLEQGGTLEGQVFDKSGEPGSHWIVMLFSAADFSQVLGNTDSAGEFRMQHLLPGEWMLFALDPGSELQVDEDGVDMAAMLGAFRMSQATLREGETTHVTIGAPPQDPVRVHGRVTLGGEPYTGVTLSFYSQGGRLYENSENTSVDGQGRYEVVLDGPGRYMVSVQALLSGAGQQNTLEFSEEIPSQDEFRLDFKMPRGRISGRVEGPDGGAAAGARITLTLDGAPRSDSIFGGQYTEITTDGSGTFDIRGLRPGSYRLSAGGSSPYSGALQAPYGRLTTGAVHVAENQWIQDVVLRLAGPGTIEVHVLDAVGHPLSQATLFVRDSSGRMLEPFAGVLTDATGSADYEGLAPGEYGVSARVAGLTCEETERVRVREGARTAVTLRLEQGTVLTVKLKDAAGDPAVGQVSLTDSQGREMTGLFGMQDMQALLMEGAFSPTQVRLGPLPPGKYRVTATVNGRTATKSVRLRGEPAKSTTLRVR
ncbi:MAG: carboxypeptidase regulatory-like domain-containing protein, partial [Planctomycetota bacterium]